jgi:hypothetical protein
MKFECQDLEKALAHPELLMPEAREHVKTCAQCRRELQLWADISASAPDLHEDWETPDMWLRIQQRLEAERKPAPPWWKDWRVGIAIAAALLISVVVPFVLHQQPQKPIVAKRTAGEDFLTEQALIEVEKNEAAYRKSIDQLAHLAQPKLESGASAQSVNAQEKLLMLDAAIDDTRNNVAINRFNLRLQTTLAELYREKQETLRELVTSDQNN